MLRTCLNFGKNQTNSTSRHFQMTRLKYSNQGDNYTTISECDGVRVINLNAQRTCNVLSTPMMESILKGVSDSCENNYLRCIVLTATGPVWSAGHDLKELAAASKSKQLAIFDKLTEVILNIRLARVPVIASVNGLAAAAGCQLASSCDMLVATETSKFATPGAKFGLFCSTPGVAIARSMNSTSKAAYMLMTSLPLTAREAYEAGLVTRLVPESKLDEEVGNIIAAIESQSREVIAFGKEFFYKQIQIADIRDAYKRASKAMVENLQMPDGKEGLESFKEKRSPVWAKK